MKDFYYDKKRHIISRISTDTYNALKWDEGIPDLRIIIEFNRPPSLICHYPFLDIWLE